MPNPQQFTDPAWITAPVTPADGTDLPNGTCRALYIGVSGDVVIDDGAGKNTAVLFKSVAVGILPVQAKRVRQNNTTAQQIIALY